MTPCEKFPDDALCSLRTELLHAGLDCFQVAYLLAEFSRAAGLRRLHRRGARRGRKHRGSRMHAAVVAGRVGKARLRDVVRPLWQPLESRWSYAVFRARHFAGRFGPYALERSSPLLQLRNHPRPRIRRPRHLLHLHRSPRQNRWVHRLPPLPQAARLEHRAATANPPRVARPSSRPRESPASLRHLHLRLLRPGAFHVRVSDWRLGAGGLSGSPRWARCSGSKSTIFQST